jgi:hypothetical protein
VYLFILAEISDFVVILVDVAAVAHGLHGVDVADTWTGIGW